MSNVEATQAQANFSDLLVRVGHDQERIVIEQQGRAIVALISYEDLKRLEALEKTALQQDPLAGFIGAVSHGSLAQQPDVGLYGE
jgi:prevent-host-death family protein